MPYLLPGESFPDMQRRLARGRPATDAELRAYIRVPVRDAAPRRDTSGDTHIHIHGPDGSSSGQTDAGGFGVGSAVRSAGHAATGAARAATRAIKAGEAVQRTQPHAGGDQRRFLPGRDERRDPRDITMEGGHDQEGEAGGEVLAELEPPPEGMAYSLEPGDSGGFVLVLVPEEEAQPDTTELSTADRTYRHTLRYRDHDPVLRRMNALNRRAYARPTRDQAVRVTLEQLADPGPGAHYEVVPSGSGCFWLVLVHPDQSEIAGSTPLGSSGDGPQIRSTTDRVRTSPTTARLRSMNAANARYWSGKR